MTNISDKKIYDSWIKNNKNYSKTCKELGVTEENIKEAILTQEKLKNKDKERD